MSEIEAQGFEVASDTFDRETIDSVLSSLEKTSFPRSRAGARNLLRIPVVSSLSRDPRLMQLAQASVGMSAFPFRATLFDKSLSANWLVVWHQDTALPVREKREVTGWGPWSVKDGVVCAHAPAEALRQVLAIRVHLDDSNSENGPLRVLPGTHRNGILTDEAMHDLAQTISALECHVPVGGILLMRPLLVHASSKARRGGLQRRVLHIEYASRAHFPGEIELANC